MPQIHAFDGNGVIVGTCVSPNIDQENKWSAKGLFVLHGPEIKKRLYKYVQNPDLTWSLTPKSQVELDAEAQAQADAEAAEAAKEAQKYQDYLNLPTKAEIEAAFLDNKQQAVIKKLKKAIKWLALDEGGD
jgi:hypothetical protein